MFVWNCCCVVLFFPDEALDIGLQVGWDRDLSCLADQELALEVPSGIGGASLVLEEFPDLGSGIALDLSQLHQNAGKILLGGEFRNRRVVVEFLPTKFTAGESKYHEFIAIFLVEFLELGILAVGCTSFRRNVGGVYYLAAEFFHLLGRAVALGGGE